MPLLSHVAKTADGCRAMASNASGSVPIRLPTRVVALDVRNKVGRKRAQPADDDRCRGAKQWADRHPEMPQYRPRRDTERNRAIGDPIAYRATMKKGERQG
jgi:hypothetical protein